MDLMRYSIYTKIQMNEMLDKDKLFMIVQFGVKSRPMNLRTNEIMAGFYQMLKKNLDDSIKVLLVPNPTNDEVKFELLNPTKVSDEAINNINENFKNIMKMLEDGNQE